ncbi:MAG: hypothetical protein ACIAXF_06160 [Phycisphaerales bacterium JB063]
MPDDQPRPRSTPSSAAPAAEQRGIICRQCGCGHFYVLYTRAKPGGRIMRRRECRHCGKRVTTWEM